MPPSKPNTVAKNLIYTQLRRSIIMGRLRPGERLNLHDLAQQHNTSVTPVRDAIQMLSQEGLVTIKPRSGYYVTHITLKQLRDLLELREILELAAVERAAARINDAQIAQLEQVHAGYTGEDDASVERYLNENRRLHCLIAEISGNRELALMIGRVHDQLARFMAPSHAGQSMVDYKHEQLIDALRQRDPAIARQAMLDEINEMSETTLRSVIEEEGAFWRLGTRSPSL